MLCSDLTLDLMKKNDTSPYQRDEIRISKDAILAMYLLNPVSQTLTFTFTLMFLENSTVVFNVTVESDSAGIVEESTTLDISDLNLVSKVGLRTKAEEGPDGNLAPDKNCTDKIEVLKMCSGFEESGKDKVAAVIGGVFSFCVALVFILWRKGYLQLFISWIKSHIVQLSWTRVLINQSESDSYEIKK